MTDPKAKPAVVDPSTLETQIIMEVDSVDDLPVASATLPEDRRQAAQAPWILTYTVPVLARRCEARASKEAKRKPIQPTELAEIPKTLEDMVLANVTENADDPDAVAAQRKAVSVPSMYRCVPNFEQPSRI